ncbi:uncharacterized protein si:ch211-215i13.3 isoform X1 [Acanthopagrus latus]|uniref:uncharacterized protein si:ch211-215i13.3 isoform X1 n=1 Tax=Acanthopagrus latus TaxID=8177 RepID=UPI00187C0056|nr:uncharacterized protein si:ch211-215i13.3 isoform X1 [Acanthopagrus latus]
MIFPMGCGGSRADAIIEPRYHESWTRETESTWLTNTDVETSLPVATMMSKARLSSKGKALEASLREKRMVNTGTQCGKQALASTASNHQRRPRRSITDVGVTGSSKPLATPKGGRRRRAALCLRTASPSASAAAGMLNRWSVSDGREGKDKTSLCEEEELRAVHR